MTDVSSPDDSDPDSLVSRCERWVAAAVNATAEIASACPCDADPDAPGQPAACVSLVAPSAEDADAKLLEMEAALCQRKEPQCFGWLENWLWRPQAPLLSPVLRQPWRLGETGSLVQGLAKVADGIAHPPQRPSHWAWGPPEFDTYWEFRYVVGGMARDLGFLLEMSDLVCFD